MAFLCRDIARLQTDLHIDGIYSNCGWYGNGVPDANDYQQLNLMNLYAG